ncbi:uracil-DNA glycosylase, family 4 [Candidatus Magnetoovum chiemensis]|nr:uracil-DNA glycosylase, family 4 [Candidatus Magnetoovum chiemensis]
MNALSLKKMNRKNEILKSLSDIIKFYGMLDFKRLPINVIVKKDERPSDRPTKNEMMNELHHKIDGCTRCALSKSRKNIVFGQGNIDARLMFIGNAPEAEDDELGKQFVGASGSLLTNLINKLGLSRDDVYITNIVKCRPPQDISPEENEIRECFQFLEKQIEIIKPDCIMTLGNKATQTLLNTDEPITKLRGQFHLYKDIKVMPTFHPSHLLKKAQDKHLTWNDALKILSYLGIEVIGFKGIKEEDKEGKRKGKKEGKRDV